MSEGSKFCANCGAHLSRVCATCGHPNQANSNFCSDCGASLNQNKPASSATVLQRPSSSPGPAEHRQLSVMFCDLVDSVGLGERLDPESLRDILRDYQHRATKIPSSLRRTGKTRGTTFVGADAPTHFDFGFGIWDCGIILLIRNPQSEIVALVTWGKSGPAYLPIEGFGGRLRSDFRRASCSRSHQPRPL